MNAFISLTSKYWWSASLVMLTIVTIASLIPLPVLPDVPGSDKTHHLISYALVMLPIALHKPRFWFLFALGIVLWSGVIELVQPFVNRYGEWLDLRANLSGVLIGCMFGFVLKYIKGRVSGKGSIYI